MYGTKISYWGTRYLIKEVIYLIGEVLIKFDFVELKHLKVDLSIEFNIILENALNTLNNYLIVFIVYHKLFFLKKLKK